MCTIVWISCFDFWRWPWESYILNPMIPLMKLRYSLMVFSQLSMVNTLCKYSLMLFLFFLLLNKLNRACLGIKSKTLNSSWPSSEKCLPTKYSSLSFLGNVIRISGRDVFCFVQFFIFSVLFLDLFLLLFILVVFVFIFLISVQIFDLGLFFLMLTFLLFFLFLLLFIIRHFSAMFLLDLEFNWIPDKLRMFLCHIFDAFFL